jgi:hypothetical protein
VSATPLTLRLVDAALDVHLLLRTADRPDQALTALGELLDLAARIETDALARLAHQREEAA